MSITEIEKQRLSLLNLLYDALDNQPPHKL